MTNQTSHLSPYDTGERCEPRVWMPRTMTQWPGIEYLADQLDSFGKVDFNNDEDATIVTAHVERLPDGRHRLVVDPQCGVEELEILVLHDSDGSPTGTAPTPITTLKAEDHA